MDKLRKIREEVDSRHKAAEDANTRHDFFMVDLHLHDFENHLKKSIEHRMVKIAKKMKRDNQFGELILRDTPMPCLFLNEEPVKRLFLYNILCRITKEDLYAFLINKGCENFTIEKVISQRNSSVAILNCKNLASSALIQTLACSKKLLYTYRDGKSSYFRTRVEAEYNRLNHKNEKKSSTVEKKILLPELLRNLLSCSIVIDNISSFLNSEDFFAFYEACNNPPSFHSVRAEFKSSISRYNNNVELMFEDAKNLYFKKFKFIDNIYPVPAYIVIKILHITLRNRVIPYKHLHIKELNLTDVVCNNDVIDFLSENYSVEKLTMSSTTTNAEKSLLINGINELSIVRNNEFKFHAFHQENFKMLKILKIDSCKVLRVKSLLDFIRTNKTLEEVHLTRIQTTDAHPSDIMEAVISGGNSIRSFHYNYIDCSTYPVEMMFPPNVKLSPCIKTLDLSYNSYMNSFINVILDKTPFIKNLFILGLNITYPLRKCTLNSLEINYNQCTNNILNNLDLSELTRLKITNNFGKAKTKCLDSQHIFQAFNVSKPLFLKYEKCKFEELKRLKRTCRNIGMMFTQQECCFTISYRPR